MALRHGVQLVLRDAAGIAMRQLAPVRRLVDIGRVDLAWPDAHLLQYLQTLRRGRGQHEGSRNLRPVLRIDRGGLLRADHGHDTAAGPFVADSDWAIGLVVGRTITVPA